jgi:glycosyltransferase involved in cell wall biosynthesis
MGCLPGSACAEKSVEYGIQVFTDFNFRRGFRPLDFWKDCRLLARRLDIEAVDVIHAHLSQESWIACVAAQLANRDTVVIRSRGVVVPVQPHAFNRLMHNGLTDHVVVPSTVIYSHLRSLPGFDPTKVSLIYDGVDLARFGPTVSGRSVRKEFNIPEEAPLIAMVARLEAVKGHEVFFKALCQLRGKLSAVKALCACDERTPGKFDETVNAARRMGLGEDVLSFTGMRNDVERIYAAADVVALPSLGSEGSSRVSLEAMAAARPIVASTVGCLAEMIQEGLTGFLTPPNDPTALADALAKVLENREQARRMGINARIRAEMEFGEDLMAESLEDLYLRVLEDRAVAFRLRSSGFSSSGD